MLLGAKTYRCDDGHEFLVDADWEPSVCPMACPAGTRIRPLDEKEIPVFALTVEDIRGMGRRYRSLTVEECLEVGGGLETDWGGLETAADIVLRGRERE